MKTGPFFKVGIAVSVLIVGSSAAQANPVSVMTTTADDSARGVVPIRSGEDWVQWDGNGHYYKAVSVPGGITWFDARDAAVSQDGYMATCTSAEENEFVFSLIDSHVFWFQYSTGWWQGPYLGGYQAADAQEPNEGWAWVTGEPFDFAHWAPGQPDDNGWDADYVAFTGGFSGGRGSWWDDQTPDGASASGYLPMLGYVIESPVPEPTSAVSLGVLCLLPRYGRSGRVASTVS